MHDDRAVLSYLEIGMSTQISLRRYRIYYVMFLSYRICEVPYDRQFYHLLPNNRRTILLIQRSPSKLILNIWKSEQRSAMRYRQASRLSL